MTSRQLDEEAVFHVARVIPTPAARSTYLDQVCAGDQALRERVEALLEIHEKEHDFLKSSPESAPTADHTPLTERPGMTIGRYKLMEQIGEGGMGTVFVAEQERPIRRKVALKVIKPGMDSKAVVARFEAERQALAMMDHPNIAKVLDAGTTDSGRPYFAMELVKGIPITDYCDQNRLTVRDRLGLFIQVCQSIQHAHHKGIIHRDVKPSNVLVTLHDGKPVTKVIDFGVSKALNARLTDKTVYTEHLQIVGTLLYMSPEQAELSGLDVDTRSDVYSLGVLLYELLTGTTPFQKAELGEAAVDEQRRIICEQDPPRASVRISSLGETATAVAEHRQTDAKRLLQLVRGDLDWIVLKALEKDRTRRYEAANSLAADIERLLGDQPIEARPPSAAYRFRKFARRNRSSLVVSAAMAALLITGLVLVIARNRELGEAYEAVKQSRSELADTNNRLNDMLTALQTELLDRALGDALAGDVVVCEYSLARAEQARASKDLIQVFRGLAWMYGGRLSDAIDILEKARQDTPDSLAVLAALMWAYYQDGEIQMGTEVSDQIAYVQSIDRRPEGDYERLLVAHTKVFSTYDPNRLIAELDDIISRHPGWGIAYAIRAESSPQLAKQTRRMSDLDSARSDVQRAARYHPDNAFVLASGMHAYITSIELARHQGIVSKNEQVELELHANELAEQLAARPSYLFGIAMRSAFLELMNRKQESEEGTLNIPGKSFGGDQPIVAKMLVERNASERLEAYLAEHPHSFAAQTAASLFSVLEGNSPSASEVLETLRTKFTNLNQRWLMLDVALATQNQALARRMARVSYVLRYRALSGS